MLNFDARIKNSDAAQPRVINVKTPILSVFPPGLPKQSGPTQRLRQSLESAHAGIVHCLSSMMTRKGGAWWFTATAPTVEGSFSPSGSLKLNFCSIVVKKRNSSIRARASPGHERFPVGESKRYILWSGDGQGHRGRYPLPKMVSCRAIVGRS